MVTKRNVLPLVFSFCLLFISLIAFFSNPQEVIASGKDPDCSDIWGYETPDDLSWDAASCYDNYTMCQSNPFYITDQESYGNCIGDSGCNSMYRWEYVTPANCGIDENNNLDYSNDYFDPEGEWFPEDNLKYCECVTACYKKYRRKYDCDDIYKSCCLDLADSKSPIPEESEYEITIVKVIGDVEISRGGRRTYVAAKVGDKLNSGDYITTGFESRCIIKIGDEFGVLHVYEETYFSIKQIYIEGDLEKTQASIIMGRLYFLMHLHDETYIRMHPSFEIETPVAVTSWRGTILSVEHDKDENVTGVETFEGEVTVTDNNGFETIIGANKRAAFDQTGRFTDIESIPPEEQLSESDITELFGEIEDTGDTTYVSSGIEDYIDPTLFIILSCTAALALIPAVLAVILFRKKKKVAAIILVIITLGLCCSSSAIFLISFEW